MGWTVVSETWLFFCILVAVVYLIVDGREVLSRAFTLFYRFLSSKKDISNSQGEASTSPTEVKEPSTENFLCKTVQGFWESQSDQSRLDCTK